MFDQLEWIVEVINVILCLHFLYGRKIQSKIATGVLIAVDFFVMQISFLALVDEAVVSLTYVMFFVYVAIEFGEGIKKSILSIVLLIDIMGLLELLSIIPWVIFGYTDFAGGAMLILHVEVLILILLFRRQLEQLFAFVLKRNIVMIIVSVLFAVYFIRVFVRYRIRDFLSAEQIIFVLVFGVLISTLVYSWQHEREVRQAKEMELKIHNLYDASFRELLDTIRKKQHDFYNHIQTISCQHYTIHTYEELVEEQTRYCEDLYKDNRYYDLLKSDSPVISGFLYGKFSEAYEQGIEVTYSVGFSRRQGFLPEYILVEIIGILWDNAVQYVCSSGDKRIDFLLKEREDVLTITVQNPVSDVSYEDLTEFFVDGYSKKEGHQGVGLSKIREYGRKYHLNIKALKQKRDSGEWLSISLTTEKTAIG